MSGQPRTRTSTAPSGVEDVCKVVDRSQKTEAESWGTGNTTGSAWEDVGEDDRVDCQGLYFYVSTYFTNRLNESIKFDVFGRRK